MALLAKTAVLVTLACSSVSGPALAGGYGQVDELAGMIERQARLLEREMSVYRWSREYIHLLADTRRLSRIAAYMQDVAHAHGCLDHLKSHLRQLDAVFHHLEGTIEHVEEDCLLRHYGLTGSTLPVLRLMHSMELNIYHLQNALRSLNQRRHVEQYFRPARPIGCVETSYYQARPNPWSRQITIGGGSTRFTIRF